MKQIRFLLVMLLAAMSVDAIAQNPIWKDPTNNVEYELNMDKKTASVKAGDALESDVYPAHEGLTGDIVIPEKVRDEFTVVEIGQGAFMENPGITSITIPKTVTYIGRAAFSECTGCTDIYCYANPSKLVWWIFDYYPEGKPDRGTKFHVPAGYLSKYKSMFSEANVTFVGDLPDEDDTGSIISTFNGWQGEDTSMLNGIMLTEEGNDWYLNVPQTGLSVSQVKIGPSYDTAENCLEISGSSGSLQAKLSSMFPVAGPIAKIIIRAAEVYSINVIVQDASNSGTSSKLQQKRVDVQSSDALKDIVISLDGSIEYVEGAVSLEIKGMTPMHISKITIVQKEAEAATSGKTGDLDWRLEKLDGMLTIRDKNGNMVDKPKYRLIISGNGDMPDYNQKRDDATGKYYYDTPWCSFETITELVIEEGVKSIGTNAFSDVSYMNKAKLPSSLRLIGFGAFDGTSILSIDLPEGLETIANYAFAYCYNLKDITLPASLKNVYEMSFWGNYFNTLTVASGNGTYDSRDNCNAVILTAENQLIAGTPTTVIPATVTSIGEYAFGNSRKTSLVIPDGVTSIGKNAFIYSSSMESLTIGSGVTTIGENAFKSTEKLADVNFYANPATLTWTGFDAATNFMADKATKIHVKKADLATWQANFGGVNATFVGDLDGGEAEDEGDANGDGEIDVADIDFVIEHIGEPIDDTNRASDVNGDGEINVADVDYIIERIK